MSKSKKKLESFCKRWHSKGTFFCVSTRAYKCCFTRVFSFERPSSKPLSSHKLYSEETIVNHLSWTRPVQAKLLRRKSGFKDLLRLGHLQSATVKICVLVADWHRRGPSGWYTCKNLAVLCALLFPWNPPVSFFPPLFSSFCFFLLPARWHEMKTMEKSVVHFPFCFPCKNCSFHSSGVVNETRQRPEYGIWT